MQDRVYTAAPQQSGDGGGVAVAADFERRGRRHGGAMAGREVVEDGDGVAGLQKGFHRDRSDVAGAAGNQDVHSTTPKAAE